MFCIHNRGKNIIDWFFGKKNRKINYKTDLVCAKIQKDTTN